MFFQRLYELDSELIHSFHEEYPDISMEIFQGTYDDVVYWIKNGVVDVGFLSVSSAADIPIEPLYKDPLLCVVQKGGGHQKEPMSIEK